MLLIPSISYAQSDQKISALTTLSSPASNDILPVTDVSAGSTKSITLIKALEGATGVTDDSIHVANGTTIEAKVLPSCSNATSDKLLYNSTTNTLSCGTDQNSGGGGGLGINLSSSVNQIVSDTGTIDFDDDNLVTTGTMQAAHFVATGGTISTFDDLEVLNEFKMPAIQDCSTVLSVGEVCIDGNINNMTDVMSFMGEDGLERININILKSSAVGVDDADTLQFDVATHSWISVPAAIPVIGGTEGTEIHPLTPSTTDVYIGDLTSVNSDIWLKATGGAIFNQQNGDTHFNVQGTGTEYLIYTTGDQVSFGTNTPEVGATLTVQGTLSVSGTLDSYIGMENLLSADPCTNAGTGTVPNNSIFLTSAGIICACNSSGVAKRADGTTSCF